MLRIKHLDHLEHVVLYLEKFPDKRLSVDSSQWNLKDLPVKRMSESRETTQTLYPDAEEEDDSVFPIPLGNEIQTSAWFESNHARDRLT